jgi:hypothetical protein
MPPRPRLLAMPAMAFPCTAHALLLPLCAAAAAVPARAMGGWGAVQALGIALVGGGLGGVFALPVVRAWRPGPGPGKGPGEEAGPAAA